MRHRAKVKRTMGAKVKKLATGAALALCLLAGQGCASLSPSAAREQPETGGGLKVSDNTRTGITIFGTVLYWAGNLLTYCP